MVLFDTDKPPRTRCSRNRTGPASLDSHESTTAQGTEKNSLSFGFRRTSTHRGAGNLARRFVIFELDRWTWLVWRVRGSQVSIPQSGFRFNGTGRRTDHRDRTTCATRTGKFDGGCTVAS